MASRITSTGLVGLKVLQRPRSELKHIYEKILGVLKDMPESAAYRKHTETYVKERLQIVIKNRSRKKIESLINGGQLEEVAAQARQEYQLARNMRVWKPWEGEVTAAPEGQWEWPY